MSRFLPLALIGLLAGYASVRGQDKDVKPRGLRLLGRLEPTEVVDIGAQVSGRIVRLGADPKDKTRTLSAGSEVKAGTLLAEIDSSLFEGRLEAAKAALVRAEAELNVALAKAKGAMRNAERLEQLRRTGAVPLEEAERGRTAADTAQGMVEVRKAAIAQGRAALREAEINLGFCRIVAPVDGVVIERRVNVGQTVVATLKAPSLFLIASDLRRMHVLTKVAESDIAGVKIGQPARGALNSGPKKMFTGKVSEVRLDGAKTGAYTVVIDVNNEDRLLFPYQSVTVLLEPAER
ncbi:MAG: efflux RND transporter periplasmic adaptor subunit [Gemmataceae bacterium]